MPVGVAQPRTRRLSPAAVRTIATAFNPRDNGITPLRLGLALAVIYSHSFVTGGFGFDPLYRITGGQMQLGTAAVISFFGLSGFLLARSRASSAFVPYLRNRVLRVVPGLWACVGVTALAAIPVAVALGGRAPPDQVSAFVLRAMTFQGPLVIDGLYPGSALSSFVNAPLWTLAPEMLCYVGLGLIGWCARTLRSVVLAVALASFGVAHMLADGTWLLVHLPVAFLVGTLLFHHAARVPLASPVAFALLALTVAAAMVGSLGLVAPLTLPYLALWIGLTQPLRWKRDLSYGAYIHAWPIQQLLTTVGVASLGWASYIALTVPLVLGVAYVSAVLIEEPAMRLRYRPAATAKSPAPTG